MKTFLKVLAVPVAVLTALAWAPVAEAQGQPKPAVPTAEQPPPGMCRIWLDGVPAARQPQPTDCPTAIRRKPPNGQVIWGPKPARTTSDSTEQTDREKSRPKPPQIDRPGSAGGPSGLPIRNLRECSDRDKKDGKCDSPPKPPKKPKKGSEFKLPF
jgi:hypothetical protein